jgi:uncharacterized protein (TIRG00374 family)
MKKRVFIGTILSLLFLYLAFRKTDFSEILQNIRETRLVFLIPAVLLTLLGFYIRAVRWRHLLANMKEIPVSRLWSATMIGFMANNLLPARLGELFRAHVIGRWESISRSSALATIGMERVFDLFTMLFLFGLISIFFPLTPVVRTVGISGLVLGFIVLGLFLSLHRLGDRAVAAFGRILPGRLRERGMAILASFQEGLGVLREGRQLLWAAGYSLLMWGIIIVVVQCCFWAVDIRVDGEPLHPSASVVVLVVMALGLMVPSGPGFVGSLQFFAVQALDVFQVKQETALSFSIVYHATQWFPVTLVGLFYLFREDLSLKDVARTTGEAEGEEPSPLLGNEAVTSAGERRPGQ